MQSKIRVLSEQTINQIAAGEVIENPASVVKELVENSIDARATEITVEVRSGGRQLIRVSDNGCGMSPDDAVLCLERHATSKIQQLDDLHAISTMGFRGEAVPSIASIAKVNILTRPHEKAEGTMVMVDGGQLVSCTPAACAAGTTIEVKNLFFNVPVRKKFQKSPAYDTQEIQKTLTLIALANPNVHFHLISNQETLLQTRGSSLKERIQEVLGSGYSEEGLPINIDAGPYHLEGYLGAPYLHRPNRTGQYLFINQRPVVSSMIAYAVREGYGMVLPPNRFPVFILYLTLPGDEVDVNVHPQKKEVRLSHEQKLKELIIRGIENALRPSALAEAPAPLFESKPIQNFHYTASIPEMPFPPLALKPPPSPPPRMQSIQMDLTPAQEPYTPPPVKALAIIHGCLIVDMSGLCLIDIQAAQARITFEKLLSQKHSPESQGLLIPYTIDLPATEARLLNAHLSDLHAMGLQIREFGPSTFLVDALPDFLSGADIAQLIKEFIAKIQEQQSSKNLEQELRNQLALTACRHVKISGERTSLAHAQMILDRLMLCENPYQSPFGTPTMIQISPEELAQRFKR